MQQQQTHDLPMCKRPTMANLTTTILKNPRQHAALACLQPGKSRKMHACELRSWDYLYVSIRPSDPHNHRHSYQNHPTSTRHTAVAACAQLGSCPSAGTPSHSVHACRRIHIWYVVAFMVTETASMRHYLACEPIESLRWPAVHSCCCCSVVCLSSCAPCMQKWHAAH